VSSQAAIGELLSNSRSREKWTCSSVVQLLVQDFQFNANQFKNFWHTPLLYAVRYSYQSRNSNDGDEMSRLLLLEHGAEEVNRAKEICRLLLEHGGADVNRGGRYGPIYSAVCHVNADVVALLLQHKADPNWASKVCFGRSPIFIILGALTTPSSLPG
jgi:Ankyrin repeat